MFSSYNVATGKVEYEENCWRRKTNMEKLLVVFIVFAVVLILGLIAALIVFFTRSPSECLTSGCVQVTDDIQEYMDPEIDPCDDFYHFSCGTFMDQVELFGEPTKNIETFLRDDFNDRIRGVIQEPKQGNDSSSLLMAKLLHKACMNASAVQKGVETVKEHLQQIGGWAALEGEFWSERDYEWTTALYRLRQLGYDTNIFIVLRAVKDENDPNKTMLAIYSPWNLVDDASPERTEWLFNYMVDTAVAFGANRDRAQIEYRDVIDFFISLLPSTEEEQIEHKGGLFTIAELQSKVANIPWFEYIKQSLFPISSISYNENIMVSDISYLIRLQNALQSTSKRIVSNVVAWRTVIEISGSLTSNIAEISRNYFRALNKDVYLPPMPPRFQICSSVVENVFPLPVQVGYIKKFIPSQAKEHVTEMLDNIIDEFREKLGESSWMDDFTRSTAVERLANIKKYIAFPDEIFNDDKIEEIYSRYQMQEDNFLSCILNANYNKLNAKYRRLHSQTDEEVSDKYTYRRIYYSADDNSITIPARVLLGIMYDEEGPQCLNYGALGATIGHQLYHAVFAGKSCYQNPEYYDWLSPEALSAFEEKLTCVENHYSNYDVPEINLYLNASNTRTEDIADIAGLKLAYDAYDEWVEVHGKEKKLPGLKYTSKQLFWIASAIRFCSKSTLEALHRAVTYSYESLKEYRVLGSLRNLEDFSRDFNCPLGSYMNDGEKCQIF